MRASCETTAQEIFTYEGAEEGWDVGWFDGRIVGCVDGCIVGLVDGCPEGPTGLDDGWLEG